MNNNNTPILEHNNQPHNSLSFHALRAKFHHHNNSHQDNNSSDKKLTAAAAAALTVESAIHTSESAVRKKTSNPSMPRRITEVARDFSDHFPLKRNHSSNDLLPTSKTSPLLWPSSISSSSITTSTTTATTELEEEEIEKTYHHHLEVLSHSQSSLGIAPATVPRTGSFVTELSNRLAQSERKGEHVSHTILSMRRSEPHLIVNDQQQRDQDAIPSVPLPPPPPSHHHQHNHHHQHHLRKSVPTSTSSPSLVIVNNSNNTSVEGSSSSSSTMMKRSMTGTSVQSMASISSFSTTATSTSKKSNHNNWYFSHWFSGAQLPPLPMTTSTTLSTLSEAPVPHHSTTSIKTTATTENQTTVKEATIHDTVTATKAIKRTRVIQELLATEKTYQADMELIQEIYFNNNYETTTPFSKIEIKHIFINLLDIIAFEKDFVTLLEAAATCSDEEDLEESHNTMIVGIAFSIMMNRMDHIYGEYCKKHEDAACKLQELSSRPNVQAFLLRCKDKMQGRTTCWDLPSLLIKPVQRVLKYPLLLREILACTPENHPDYEQLMMVTQEIQQMADHINEIKRRKDIVEQLISDKKILDRNVVQGINKKFTRRAHRKKATTTNLHHDTLFDELYRQFELRQEMARQFERGVGDWLLKVKQNLYALSDLVHSLESVYGGDSDGIGLRSMHAFRKLVSQLDINSVEIMVQASVYTRIEAYLKLFKNPSHLIQKRNRKLLDYDRARHLLSNGEVPDKQLQTSAEQYFSLNAHLLDELPTFLTLAETYFDIILDEFIRIQAIHWRRSRVEWNTLTIELPFGKEHTWSSIESDYKQTMKRIESRIHEIMVTRTMEKQVAVAKQESLYSLKRTPSSSMTVSLSSFLDEDRIAPRQIIRNSRPPSTTTTTSLSLNDITVTTTNKKYDSLFSESQPVFQCVALVDYESPERLQVYQGDLIQIWLPTSDMTTSSSNGTESSSGVSSATTAATEWWYGSLATPHEGKDQIYGWLPSTICERI